MKPKTEALDKVFRESRYLISLIYNPSSHLQSSIKSNMNFNFTKIKKATPITWK